MVQNCRECDIMVLSRTEIYGNSTLSYRVIRSGIESYRVVHSGTVSYRVVRSGTVSYRNIRNSTKFYIVVGGRYSVVQKYTV